MKSGARLALIALALFAWTLPAAAATGGVEIHQYGEYIQADAYAEPDFWDQYYCYYYETCSSTATMLQVTLKRNDSTVNTSEVVLGVFGSGYGWIAGYAYAIAGYWVDPGSAGYTAIEDHGLATCAQYSYCNPYDAYGWSGQWTGWSQDSLYYTDPYAPQFTLSPDRGVVNQSGYVVMYGQNLDQQGTVVRLNGQTLTPGYQSADQINAAYGASLVSSVGSKLVEVTNSHGSASAYLSIEASDRTPVITYIDPPEWPAGQTTNFVIHGQNFGTSPEIHVTCGGSPCQGVGSNYGVTNGWDHQISAWVSVASGAPLQDVQVSVTSLGLWGNGFFQGAQQPPPSPVAPSFPAIIVPAPAPLKIYRGTQDVTGTTITVIIGEMLTSGVEAKVGSNPATGGTWSIPSSAIGGYISTLGFGGQPLGVPTYDNIVGVFGFKEISSQPVALSYTLGSQVATVLFNVVGPTVTKREAVGRGTVDVDTNGASGSVMALHYGGPSGFGIAFEGAISVPSGYQGHIEWIQVINSVTRRALSVAGTHEEHTFQCQGSDGSTMPYRSGNTTNDSPTQPINTEGTLEPGTIAYTGVDGFDATDSYTMWMMFFPDATPSSGGSPPPRVRIPLGKIDWGWNGSVLWTGALWVGGGVGGPSGTTTIASTPDFPQWNSNSGSCVWQ